MKTKTKSKKKKAVAAAAPTLVRAIYNQVQDSNFRTEYGHTTDMEAVTMFPMNAFAEKITVKTSKFDVGETRVEAYRIHRGEKEVSLDVICKNDSPREEAAALSIIKTLVKRFC